MNIANKLTILRILLVPVMVALLLLTRVFELSWLLANLVFIAASITDAVDGNLARKRGLVTDFGKFLDPLADKVLVVSALVMFIWLDLAHPVAVILIIAREFMVSGVRLLAVSADGTVIAANIWGKLKTTLQMTAIIATLTFMSFGVLFSWEWLVSFAYIFSNIAVWVAAAVTLISGVVYLVQNKQYLSAKS